MWQRHSRLGSGGNLRLSQFTEWATVFQGGIRLSKLAKERWVEDCNFAEIYIDESNDKLAFRPITEASFHSYKICQQGDIINGNPTFYIPCRSAITSWRPKTKRLVCFLREAEGGLIEVVPIQEYREVPCGDSECPPDCVKVVPR